MLIGYRALLDQILHSLVLVIPPHCVNYTLLYAVIYHMQPHQYLAESAVVPLAQYFQLLLDLHPFSVVL